MMDPNCSNLDLSIKTTVNILDLHVKVANQLSISPLSSNASSARIVLAPPEGLEIYLLVRCIMCQAENLTRLEAGFVIVFLSSCVLCCSGS